MINKRNEIFLFVGLFSILLPTVVHAYAGPGAAIGVIIVFITVLIAFFASFFISIFRFFKKIYIFLKNYFANKKKLSKINNKRLSRKNL